ncbi:MAG: hypothetical protein EXR83_12385 [Gammaproteobacteria bacterium]|nr:hypothetical protein [Gammaproteobacteria bacterium]
MNTHQNLNVRALRLLAVLVGSACSGATALAQQPTQAQGSAIRQACRADFQSHCTGVPTGGQEALACLVANAATLTPPCQQALQAVSGAPTAAGAPKTTTAAAAPKTTTAAKTSARAVATHWPHVVPGPHGSATIYEPQVISWQGHQTLKTRIAVGLTSSEDKAPALGTLELSFATQTDLGTRTVTLTDAKLLSLSFPSLDAPHAARAGERVQAALNKLGTKEIPLDTILLRLRGTPHQAPASVVKNDPPVIFVSERPASLVVIDGEPVLAPLSATATLSFVVNTNWQVFFAASNKSWYLLHDLGWLTAPQVKGPWTPAGKLPAGFSTLPDVASFAQLKAHIPGQPIAAKDAPKLFVSLVPAEVIITTGAPKYQAMSGLSLQYLSNSDAVVLREGAAGKVYYLVSGRWFSAATLSGPWTYTTPNLPADFARIPANGPRGFVLASVPGTAAAAAAVRQAQVPQQATLNRDTKRLEVVYAGPPQFEPIPTTSMFYAVNTSFDVIRVGDAYYACWQGAWFVAPSPTGVWALAASVPDIIYTIPSSSPLYRVTYVHVYTSSPTTVTYGYTAGYTMAYVSAGVVVYGTGWYYPPYLYAALIPIYYPYPYSYSGARYYNSATGAWASGGAIYGPYGGVAKGGTAYNPNTGAWANAGAIYGPNGGVGGFSAYNPSTGSYAQGGAVWGPNSAAVNANWYNDRTGVSGSTNQYSDPNGRQGSSQFSGPNETLNTRSGSNAKGAAGAFSSTSGAQGVGVTGANGNSAGVVKGPGGDVYAGADGNVYKKTADGWQKYDNGTWNAAPKSTQSNPANPAAGQAQRSADGATRTANGRTATRAPDYGQLEQDREARTAGAQRQQNAQRSGSFEGRNAGAGGGFQGRAGGGGGRARR